MNAVRKQLRCNVCLLALEQSGPTKKFTFNFINGKNRFKKVHSNKSLLTYSFRWPHDSFKRPYKRLYLY